MAQAVVLCREKVALKEKTVDDSAKEVERFRRIRDDYVKELEALCQNALSRTGKKEAGIFRAYRDIAGDDSFFDRAVRQVMEKHINADWAIEQEKKRVLRKFEAIPDPYLKERAEDIRNVCDEIIRRLNGIQKPEAFVNGVQKPFILVAEELSPEDTVRLEKTYLRGFITEKGGVTSHVVILAKSLGGSRGRGSVGHHEGNPYGPDALPERR